MTSVGIVYVGAVHTLLPNTLSIPTERAILTSPELIFITCGSTGLLFAIRYSVIQKFIRGVISSNCTTVETPINVLNK